MYNLIILDCRDYVEVAYNCHGDVFQILEKKLFYF
jgi:hypothetical protein